MSVYKISIQKQSDNINQDKYDRMETIYEQIIDAEATAIQEIIATVNEAWSLDRPSLPSEGSI